MALTKEDELRINAELYQALMTEDNARVIHICRIIPKGPLHTVTIHNDTVLHMATYHKNVDLALQLLDLVTPCDYHKLTWQNNGGNTILHETGTNSGTVKIAEELLRKAPMLLNITNREGETALFYAARHGKTKPFNFLHEECRAIAAAHYKTFLKRDDGFTILHIGILSRNYWVAHNIASTYPELIGEKDIDDMTPLQLLSTIKPEFHSKGFFKRMMLKMISSDVENRVKLSYLRKLQKEKHACEWALKLAVLLIKEDNSWKLTESWANNNGSKMHTYTKRTSKEQKMLYESNYNKPDTPLLLATIHDSTEIVRELLTRHPQSVEHVDKDGRTILHLAILYRRNRIIDILEEMEYPLDRLEGRVDKQYNTLLHMVGQKVDLLKEDVKHPAEELKHDQRLYTRVEKLTANLDLMMWNASQKTPYEVFADTNDKLRSNAKNWMCENAKNCSIVAVLIATVAFTSAYQIPGGYNNGHPVLKNEPAFILFTFADAISLSSALSSVIVFLNIVTSPFRFKDFASSLYERQLLGLILLIISVAMMMVAFAATLFITISTESKWTTELTLYLVSVFPVAIFVYSYVDEYMKLLKDAYKVLKKIMKEVVEYVQETWEYKPPSLHSNAGSTVHVAIRSPV
ncbi:uncharacterized protein [Rutidosis leptorrhynchoides]|uniref:uncharacterized protein n=1 Tax=Rutidosis leptorrhynchoides TaxID=125765 RepID=UPI003A9A37F4